MKIKILALMCLIAWINTAAIVIAAIEPSREVFLLISVNSLFVVRLFLDYLECK